MKTSPSVVEWIADRTPPTPRGFQHWMVPSRPEASMSVSALVDEARHSLALLRGGEVRPRDGAFDLLAADGFVTWACEAALEEPDPVASLHQIVEALVG